MKYFPAVYDRVTEVAYEGEKWSENHPAIAERHKVKTAFDYRAYFSADVFALRALPQIRVMVLDTLCHCTLKDLIALKRQGYEVMNAECQWLLEDQTSETGLTTRPSPLTEKVTPF